MCFFLELVIFPFSSNIFGDFLAAYLVSGVCFVQVLRSLGNLVAVDTLSEKITS